MKDEEEEGDPEDGDPEDGDPEDGAGIASDETAHWETDSETDGDEQRENDEDTEKGTDTDGEQEEEHDNCEGLASSAWTASMVASMTAPVASTGPFNVSETGSGRRCAANAGTASELIDFRRSGSSLPTIPGIMTKNET